MLTTFKTNFGRPLPRGNHCSGIYTLVAHVLWPKSRNAQETGLVRPCRGHTDDEQNKVGHRLDYGLFELDL
jgi:hypothetical protein